MKKFFVLVVALVAGASAFAFSTSQNAAQITAEVTQRSATESDQAIAQAALDAGIPASAVQAAMLAAGKNPTTVFDALVAAGADPGSLAPATAAGGDTGGFGAFGANRSASLSGGARVSVSPN